MSSPIDPILDPLNPEQRRAVQTLEGPLLILAGAGSGKTRTLAHRIANLIAKGLPPWQILAVTFTNKAAKEMKERVVNILKLTSDPSIAAWEDHPGKIPAMGTFHGICVKILRRDIQHLGYDQRFTIYDSDDQERLMKKVLLELHVAPEELKSSACLAAVSRLKAEAMSPMDAKKQATTERMERIVKAYVRYDRLLRESNAVDFDDLILLTVRLWRECPAVLTRYQDTWKSIHIDEYQDTNHAQYLLVQLLAGRDKNLCVIGDPDQSIYGFRGADIRNILEFNRDYPNAVSIALEQNYRSTTPILSSADSVIAVNPNRPEKRMWTHREGGAKVIVHELADERSEADEVANAVERLHRDGVPLGDQAVLYRTHAQSRVIEEACLKHGLPYRIFGGLKFYARKEVKDVLAYLTVILNPRDSISLLRILNAPPRRIGDTTIERLQAFAKENNSSLSETLERIEEVAGVAEATKQRITDFLRLLHSLRAMSEERIVADLTESLLAKAGFEKWLMDGTEEGEQRWGNVQELLTVMHRYDALSPRESLQSFLEEASLIAEADRIGEARDALTLMTLHLCKGLEYEHVMIVGCEEGIFPHSLSQYDQAQLEEERRLMYVGMTRAKSHLRLLCTQSRSLWGDVKSNAPSRFLDDLPEEHIERRSDDVLSAFVWAGREGEKRVEAETIAQRERPWHDATKDHLPETGTIPDLEFNQDLPYEQHITAGTKVVHPKFGRGTVLARRGDLVDVLFDLHGKKTLALRIAPLTIEGE